MAYAIAILRYRRPLDEMQPHVEAHRAYVRQLHEQGTVIAGGPLELRYGGASYSASPTTTRRPPATASATLIQASSPASPSTRP